MEKNLPIIPAPRPTRRARSPLARGSLWTVGILGALGWILVLVPEAAMAEEEAWVRGEVHLNVRSGASTEHRIQAGVSTGDKVTVIERGDGWTKLRLPEGIEGWVPEGYLKSSPPPLVELKRLEEEAAQLRRDLTKARFERDRLRDNNAAISIETVTQKTELDELKVRVARLQAGQGHPEMIAGAVILALGMAIGAILRRSAARRHSTRIRI